MRARLVRWAAVVALAIGAATSTARATSPATVVTIGRPQAVQAIRPGFLGLSLEFPTVEAYAGTDPSALNPVFLQLVRNISPGQQPSIRIGGDSTDWRTRS